VHSYRYSCIAATCHRDGHVCEDCVGKRVKLPGLIHRCYHESVGASAALTLSLAVHRGMGTFHSAVDRFIALTSFSKNLLVRDGIPVDKIVVKANSVPDPGEPAAVRGAERSVVFAGRLMEIKGVHTLLDAWAQAAIPGLRLRIAGDGSLRQLVEERASSDPSIEYLGWVKEDDVQDMMAGADAVIVPSEWYEGGVPLVALRSFSVGTPVIISDLPSLCEEVLADGTGFTFRVGDSASLALALRQLDQQGPASRSAMRAQARRTYLERYAPQANAEQLEAIYSTVIAERAANRSRAPRSH
jgi:glycosyltransferase involved in cell wall biosynthesis